MSMTGPPGEPTRVGLLIGDLLAGMAGTGCWRPCWSAEEPAAARWSARRCSPSSVCTPSRAPAGRWPTRPDGPGNHHPSIAPTGCSTPPTGHPGRGRQRDMWRAFAPVVGLDPDDARFATNRMRVAHRDELLAAIDAALAAAPAAVWLERLDSLGVPAGKVRSLDEVYGWEQTRAQGLVISVDHPVLGRIELPGPPLRFGDRPYAGGRQTHLPPPALGAHDVSVRAWLSGAPANGSRRAGTDRAGGNAMTAPGGRATPEDQIAAIGLAAAGSRPSPPTATRWRSHTATGLRWETCWSRTRSPHRSSLPSRWTGAGHRRRERSDSFCSTPCSAASPRSEPRDPWVQSSRGRSSTPGSGIRPADQADRALPARGRGRGHDRARSVLGGPRRCGLAARRGQPGADRGPRCSSRGGAAGGRLRRRPARRRRRVAQDEGGTPRHRGGHRQGPRRRGAGALTGRRRSGDRDRRRPRRARLRYARSAPGRAERDRAAGTCARGPFRQRQHGAEGRGGMPVRRGRGVVR